MNQSNSICFICLNGNISLKAILQKGALNDTALQVQYVFPELTIWDSVYICSLCCTSLHSFYTFKKKCLENYNRLMHKTNILQGTSGVQTQKLTEIQNKTRNQEQNMDIELIDLNIKKESDYLSPLVQEQGEQRTFADANMEDLVVSEDNSEPECFPQPEFVKCEIQSDCEQDCSSSFSEYKNTFDKEETHTDNENFSENSDSPQQKELCKVYKEVAGSRTSNLLPLKSCSRYRKEYEQFIKWCEENDASTYNEYALLAYFNFKSETLKSSSLWSLFSMLKTTLNIHHNINIEKYKRLIAFLKRSKVGYVPKKSKTLESEEIEKFISDASDNSYLLIKVALIIGMSSACRKYELVNMKVQDVEDRDDLIIIRIPDAKTNKHRTSFITEPTWINLIKKYVSLRPEGVELTRFFLFYSENRCTRQPVGIHSFGRMPSKIAEFLKLENPKEYTGHCFRRSSATVLAGEYK